MVAMEGDPGGDTPANDAVPECVEKLDAVALTSPSADAAELGCGGAVSVVCTPFLFCTSSTGERRVWARCSVRGSHARPPRAGSVQWAWSGHV